VSICKRSIDMFCGRVDCVDAWQKRVEMAQKNRQVLSDTRCCDAGNGEEL